MDQTTRCFARSRARAAHSGPIYTLQSRTQVEHVRARRMTLNMGPQHPSTHGVLRVVLELDGETIIRAEPDIGYLHTGIEKECEVKNWQQVVTLTDRVDYLANLINNLCYAWRWRSCCSWKFRSRRSGCA